MRAHDLYELANNLLRQNGFGTDGSKLKETSRKQKFFEYKTVIMTPMGNRR
jgi:hypothetical protein